MDDDDDEYDDYDEDDDYEDADEDDDQDEYDFGGETLYEVKCPTCGEVITIDEEMLDEGATTCPSCGEELECFRFGTTASMCARTCSFGQASLAMCSTQNSISCSGLVYLNVPSV